jgi:hypothetical protein
MYVHHVLTRKRRYTPRGVPRRFNYIHCVPDSGKATKPGVARVKRLDFFEMLAESHTLRKFGDNACDPIKALLVCWHMQNMLCNSNFRPPWCHFPGPWKWSYGGHRYHNSLEQRSTVSNDSVIKMATTSLPASKLLLSLLVVTALVAVRFAACKVSDCSRTGACSLCCALLILSCLFSWFCSNTGYRPLGRQKEN